MCLSLLLQFVVKFSTQFLTPSLPDSCIINIGSLEWNPISITFLPSAYKYVEMPANPKEKSVGAVSGLTAQVTFSLLPFSANLL